MGEFLVLLVLLLLSGLFSGAETAIFSVGNEKLEALKKKRANKKLRRKILALIKVKQNIDKILVTILICNNALNIAASSIATVIAIEISKNFAIFDNVNLMIGGVVGVMTFLILMFGEITPKALAHKHSMKFALAVSPSLNALSVVLFPVVFLLSRVTRKIVGQKNQQKSLSEDEIKAAIDLSEKEGQIENAEKEMVEKVLEFDQHTVETIMTPRSKVFAVADRELITEAILKNKKHKFSRIPVFHEDLDDIVGVLHIQSVLDNVLSPKWKLKKVANLPLFQPLKIPMTMKIDALQRKFQRENSHMALVYDEFGGVIGLITFEDVMEEIFGEIEDETDEAEIKIHQSGKNSLVCTAETEMEQIEDFIREKFSLRDTITEWPWKFEDENKSINYFLLEKFERFLHLREKAEMSVGKRKFIFTVLGLRDENIAKVEIEIK